MTASEMIAKLQTVPGDMAVCYMDNEFQCYYECTEIKIIDAVHEHDSTYNEIIGGYDRHKNLPHVKLCVVTDH